MENTRKAKIIKYYRTTIYGVAHDIIHPDCKGDAQIIQQLTGKNTINSATRELFRDLCGGAITFQETAMP